MFFFVFTSFQLGFMVLENSPKWIPKNFVVSKFSSRTHINLLDATTHGVSNDFSDVGDTIKLHDTLQNMFK